MKKTFSIALLILSALLFPSCWFLQDRTLAVEPAYYFTCEFEIENNSQNNIQASCETITTFDTLKEARMEGDSDELSVNANSNGKLYHINSIGLCGAPRLSYILRINEEMYTGFDSSVTSLCDYSWKEIEKVNAKQYALGLVDWTVEKNPPVWESSFPGYEKINVKMGVIAHYKIVIAEDGEVTINLISLTNED